MTPATIDIWEELCEDPALTVQQSQWQTAMNICRVKLFGQKGLLCDTLWYTAASTPTHFCLFCFLFFFPFCFFQREVAREKDRYKGIERWVHDMKFTWDAWDEIHKESIKSWGKKGKEEKKVRYDGMPITLALNRVRQNYFEFSASLGYILSPRTEWDLGPKLNRQGQTDGQTNRK